MDKRTSSHGGTWRLWWAQQHGLSLTNASLFIVTFESPTCKQRRPIPSLQYGTIPWGVKKLLDDKSTMELFLLRLPFLPAVPQPTKWSIGWWLVLLSNLHNHYYFLVNFLWFFSCEKLYSWYTIFNFVTTVWLSILYFLILHLFSEAWNTWEI